MINRDNIDPFDSNKKSHTCNYDSYKYKCLIFLDIILTYMRQYLESNVIDWIFEKCYKNGAKTYFAGIY